LRPRTARLRRSTQCTTRSTKCRSTSSAPFGGYKQSGIGREECIEELLRFTREKNIHINLRRRSGAH